LLAERGCHIPVVCLIIEGGFTTLRNIGDFLHDEPPTPVIIFGGSGRTADLISWTMRKLGNDGDIEDLRDEVFVYMTRIYHVNETQCNVLFNEMRRIVAKRSLVRSKFTTFCLRVIFMQVCLNLQGHSLQLSFEQ